MHVGNCTGDDVDYKVTDGSTTVIDWTPLDAGTYDDPTVSGSVTVTYKFTGNTTDVTSVEDNNDVVLTGTAPMTAGKLEPS